MDEEHLCDYAKDFYGTMKEFEAHMECLEESLYADQDFSEEKK